MRNGRRAGDRAKQIADGKGNFGKEVHGPCDLGIHPNEHHVGRTMVLAQPRRAVPLMLSDGLAQQTLAAVAQDGGRDLSGNRHPEP